MGFRAFLFDLLLGEGTVFDRLTSVDPTFSLIADIMPSGMKLFKVNGSVEEHVEEVQSTIGDKTGDKIVDKIEDKTDEIGDKIDKKLRIKEMMKEVTTMQRFSLFMFLFGFKCVVSCNCFFSATGLLEGAFVAKTYALSFYWPGLYVFTRCRGWKKKLCAHCILLAGAGCFLCAHMKFVVEGLVHFDVAIPAFTIQYIAESLFSLALVALLWCCSASPANIGENIDKATQLGSDIDAAEAAENGMTSEETKMAMEEGAAKARGETREMAKEAWKETHPENSNRNSPQPKAKAAIAKSPPATAKASAATSSAVAKSSPAQAKAGAANAKAGAAKAKAKTKAKAM